MRLRWATYRILLTLMVGFFFVQVACGETVDKLPKPSSYVSDFAGVFDAATQGQMESLCAQVAQKANAQIAIVTINDLEGQAPEQFTHDLQQKWGVGTKGTDRGIVMLFAIKEHKRWIEVGNGLQGAINDAKAGDIGRSMVPQLRAEQYGPAALAGAQQIASLIAADAGVTLDLPVQHTYHRERTSSRSGGSGLGLLGLILFVLFLIFLFTRGGRGGRGGGGSGLMWFLLGSLMSGGRGGGGFGGGGGFSGGGDSGGGGGGFGGFGGGDSDGGGAGGDW